jgi:hypothetical protein
LSGLIPAEAGADPEGESGAFYYWFLREFLRYMGKDRFSILGFRFFVSFIGG